MKVIPQQIHTLQTMTYEQMLAHVAYMGSLCYQSAEYTKKAPLEFVEMLIDNGHLSVLEHVTVSLVLETNRGVSHEIVRHRIGSYSQESTRYCNYSKDRFGACINFIDPRDGIALDKTCQQLSPTTIAAYLALWDAHMTACEDAYMKATVGLGIPPQIARGMLPHDLKTQVGLTYNMRQWREVISQRSEINPKAHPQMRSIMDQVVKHFQENYPVFLRGL